MIAIITIILYNISILTGKAFSFEIRADEMYHIIVNSARVKKDDNTIKTVKSVLDRAGKQYEFYFTQYAGHATELAERLTESGEKTRIIAMGGDGTLHEVLNGIKYPDKCKLGVIPAGSGNDFAAAMGIPEDDIKYAAQIIAFRAPTAIDYIQLSTGTRSINALGCGLDVEILKRAYSTGKRGKLRYITGFFKSVFSYRPHTFEVQTDGGKTRRFNGLLACLGNGRQIGGGIKLFPRSRVDDGFMDFLIVDYISPVKSFLAFAKIFFGKLDSVKETTKLRCKSATFLSDEDMTIQAEGELYEVKRGQRISAELVSGKLKFYLPHTEHLV